MSFNRCFRRAVDGSAAVEFAFLCPILVALLFGMTALGALAATVNGLEQLAAGAARTTVAGLTDAERAQLANRYIGANVASYPFLSPPSLTTTVSSNAAASTCTVALAYDVSSMPILQVARSLVPALPATVTRTAVVPQGGS